jgi:hypothetical protein
MAGSYKSKSAKRTSRNSKVSRERQHTAAAEALHDDSISHDSQSRRKMSISSRVSFGLLTHAVQHPRRVATSFPIERNWSPTCSVSPAATPRCCCSDCGV